MVRKCIVILLDGLGDRSHPCLDHQTPLQAAHTPCLDRLATMGANGLMQTMAPGLAPPSENAHFALFGYPAHEFPGRGLLEALGADIPVQENEVAILAHFVSLRRQHDQLILTTNRPAASAREMAELVAAIDHFEHEGICCRFQPSHGRDGIVVLSGAVSPFVTDSDPLHAGEALMAPLPWQQAPDAPERRQKSARALHAYLAWCHHTLHTHPLNSTRQVAGQPAINGLVSQRPGQSRRPESFKGRWGLRSLSIASGLVYWGLARYLDMAVEKVRDSTDPGLDLAQRLRVAIRADYDFVHVHSKAPDAAAHTKDPRTKVTAIEALDQGLAHVFDSLLDEQTMLVVTADHSTPSSGPQVHSGEPVPICAVGPGIRRDLVHHFDEIHCAGGALGHLRGRDFMPLVLNWLDRAKLQGLMDNDIDRPYWPAARQPFMLDKEDE